MEVREVTFLAVVLRISVALLLGGIIGLERGMKKRPAGMRTYMLVCVGACMIMLTNQYIYQVFGTGDPVRMGAPVVSGIGVLGAGTIIVTKRSQIKGLTTAAGLWAAAAVGLAVGIGFYEAAVFGGVAIFFILTVLHHLDDKVHSRTKRAEIYVELSGNLSLGEFMRQVRQMDVTIDSMQIDHENLMGGGVRTYVASLKLPKREDHEMLMDAIRQIPGVVYLETL